MRPVVLWFCSDGTLFIISLLLRFMNMIIARVIAVTYFNANLFDGF